MKIEFTEETKKKMERKARREANLDLGISPHKTKKHKNKKKYNRKVKHKNIELV